MKRPWTREQRLELLTASRAPEKRGGLLPRISRGSTAWLTPGFLTLDLQTRERVHFFCFKALSLWRFVMATTEN